MPILTEALSVPEILEIIYSVFFAGCILYISTRDNREKMLRLSLKVGLFISTPYFTFFEQWTVVILGLGSVANSFIALKWPKNKPSTILATGLFFTPALANYLLFSNLWTDLIALSKNLTGQVAKRLLSRYRLAYLSGNVLGVWFGLETNLMAPVIVNGLMALVNIYFLITQGFEKTKDNGGTGVKKALGLGENRGDPVMTNPTVVGLAHENKKFGGG